MIHRPVKECMRRHRLVKSVAVFALFGATTLMMNQGLADSTGETIFKTNCVSCHGQNGEGTPGVAPALRGDAFVVSGSVADIENTIQNGRSGDQKHYKDIPVAMPAWHFPQDKLSAVVAYIRGDLQKK
jgi:mono/diheme cytochrome c family protein